MAAANPSPTVIDYALQLAAASAAALGMSFGGDPAASNRTGFFGDLTASAEKIQTVVGGQTGPYYQRNASTVDAYFPGAVTITGNLTVNGTTTTINSTTVDVDDRVIRVNKASGANDPAPTNICGISVYRGAIASVARDHYGLFWDEATSLWKLAVNTGGDDATLGAYLSLQALAITGTTITANTGFVGGAGTFTSVTNSALTSGRVPVAGAAGLMADFSTLTYASGTGLVADQLTSSGLTSGRITTAGTAGKLQDFAGLILTGTPSSGAIATGSNAPASSFSGIAHQTDGVATSAFIPVAFGNGSTVTVGCIGYACQGSVASPGATTTGDAANFGLRGHDGSGFVTSKAVMQCLAGSTWTTSNREAYIQFATTANGSLNSVTAGRVDPNQTLVWGGAFNSVGTFSAGTQRPHIQTAATSAANCNIAQSFWAASATGPTGIFAKSRSGTVGTQGVITTGDTLGTMSWQGDDGTSFIEAAQIVCVSTGTIATGQVPGILRLRTASPSGTMTTGYTLDSGAISNFAGSNQTGLSLYSSATVTPRVQVSGTTTALPGALSVAHFQNTTGAGSLYLAKSRSGTIGTMTIVTTGDTLGTLDFQGADGTNFVSGAQIVVTATGTPASTRMGASMLFKTATDAAPSVMTTALTLDNTQGATFAGNVTFTDAKNLAFGSSTGCKIGTATTQKIAFWNVAPVAQYATTGTTTGFTAGAGTAVDSAATFTGNTGSTAYTVGDIVRALKLCGVMAA